MHPEVAVNTQCQRLSLRPACQLPGCNYLPALIDMQLISPITPFFFFNSSVCIWMFCCIVSCIVSQTVSFNKGKKIKGKEVMVEHKSRTWDVIPFNFKGAILAVIRNRTVLFLGGMLHYSSCSGSAKLTGGGVHHLWTFLHWLKEDLRISVCICKHLHVATSTLC